MHPRTEACSVERDFGCEAVRRRLVGLSALLGGVLLLLLGGCASIDRSIAGVAGSSTVGGTITIESLIGDGRLGARFTEGIYTYDGRSTLTLVLTDGPAETAVHAAVVRLLWVPRGVETPSNRTATNITVHYILFAGDSEVGVFEGAGFMLPLSSPGDPLFRGRISQASIRMADRSTGFVDRLGPADLTGGLVVREDKTAVTDVLRVLAERIERRLGYPRLVESGDPMMGLAWAPQR